MSCNWSFLNYPAFRLLNTGWKVSVLEVILARIFSHSDAIRRECRCGKTRTRITPNTDTFYAAKFCWILAVRHCASNIVATIQYWSVWYHNEMWNFTIYVIMKELTLKEQKQPPEVFYKKGVLRNFSKFTWKHLCQSLFFNKVAGLRQKKKIKAYGLSGAFPFFKFCYCIFLVLLFFSWASTF